MYDSHLILKLSCIHQYTVIHHPASTINNTLTLMLVPNIGYRDGDDNDNDDDGGETDMVMI